MIRGFIILIGLLLAGNVISDMFSLPVPGSVIGMSLMGIISGILLPILIVVFVL